MAGNPPIGKRLDWHGARLAHLLDNRMHQAGGKANRKKHDDYMPKWGQRKKLQTADDVLTGLRQWQKRLEG